MTEEQTPGETAASILFARWARMGGWLIQDGDNELSGAFPAISKDGLRIWFIEHDREIWINSEEIHSIDCHAWTSKMVRGAVAHAAVGILEAPELEDLFQAIELLATWRKWW